MRYLIAVAALALGGCVAEQPASPAMAQKLGETCRAYGFKSGSDAYAACVYNLDQQRIASNRQRRMAVAAAMGNIGAQMQANSQSYQRPVQCVSRPAGSWVGKPNRLVTTCY